MTEETTKPVSRRTVAKGAAWATPVILGGVAAPAYAASGGGPVVQGGPGCKLPGNSCANWNKGYLFRFTITNNSAKQIWLYTGGSYGPTLGVQGESITLTFEGAEVGTEHYEPGDHIPVPAGATVYLSLNAGSNSNSQDLVFTMTASFQWGHTQDPDLDTEHVNDPATVSYLIDGTEPCEDCSLPPVP